MKQQLEDQNQMEIWQTAEGYELRYYAFDEENGMKQNQ